MVIKYFKFCSKDVFISKLLQLCFKYFQNDWRPLNFWYPFIINEIQITKIAKKKRKEAHTKYVYFVNSIKRQHCTNQIYKANTKYFFYFFLHFYKICCTLNNLIHWRKVRTLVYTLLTATPSSYIDLHREIWKVVRKLRSIKRTSFL